MRQDDGTGNGRFNICAVLNDLRFFFLSSGIRSSPAERGADQAPIASSRSP
ncbi:MAG TPA: hypothetical protein VHZ03_12100 [Trebonia sp.]|jgi:hypothetical protein|nr:hypothetical protein [Trebonia sp.]